MNEAAPDDETPVQAYSLAFEALVQGDNDLVGLLAYATYKQSIREAALAGQVLPERTTRNIQPAMVSALRSSAEQMLTRIVSDGIDQATPDIQNTATIATLNSNLSELLSAVESAEQRIEQHVTERTGYLPAFFTNLAAWAVTLLVAVSILYISSRPSIESTIITAIENTPEKTAQGKKPNDVVDHSEVKK